MSELRDSRTLGELASRQARIRPDAIALLHGDRSTDFALLDTRARRVASGLAAMGAKRGDRIGYLGKNSDVLYEVVFGAAKTAVAAVPLNWRLAQPELAAIVADAGIEILVVGPGFGDLAGSLPVLHRLSFDGANAAWPDFAAWRDSHAPAADAVVDPDDTALQLYTSGTTGLPKGVELSHRALLATFVSAAAGGWAEVGPSDTLAMCMPCSHVAGVNVGLIGLAQGARVAVLAEFDPATLIETIPRLGVTWILLVPAAILFLLQHPTAAGAQFGSVKYLIYGASPIAEALVERARAAFPEAGLVHVYGLTEACGAGTILPPEAHDPAAGKLRSCGKPYPGFELKILDPNGRQVKPGEVGEIVFRSPTLMKGYWKNPEATRAAIDSDGWLHTGDAAWMDDEGYVYVHDRVKDMIVSGGENVYPAEVENALFGYESVADVAVIGVPDPRWGEAVKAIVVPKPGTAPTEEEIVAYARTRIAGFKVPKSVDFVDVLPRNASGKVLRRTLRAPFWEGLARRVN